MSLCARKTQGPRVCAGACGMPPTPNSRHHCHAGIVVPSACSGALTPDAMVVTGG